MFAKALILFAVASQALATVFITNPIQTTTLTAGEDATVSWMDDGKSPSLKDFGPARVSIYAGNAQQQTSLQVIASEVDVSTTSSVQFKVDASIGPDSREYFIRVESLSLKDAAQPQYPALAFSAKFGLTGMTGAFTAEVLRQIEGQSTAPLAAPTNSGVGSGATLASSVAAGSRSASSSSARPTSSGAADDDESGAVSNVVGLASLVMSTLVGIAML